MKAHSSHPTKSALIPRRLLFLFFFQKRKKEKGVSTKEGKKKVFFFSFDVGLCVLYLNSKTEKDKKCRDGEQDD
jgi:hypothetical protein